MRWTIVLILVLAIAYYNHITKPIKKTLKEKHMEGFCQGVSSFREHTLMDTRVSAEPY
jgi:hypothetical protein